MAAANSSTTALPPTSPFTKTPFATKYGPGVPRDPSAAIGPTGYYAKSGPLIKVKSGLTLFTPLPANPDAAIKKQYNYIEAYQKFKFLGFTSKGLVELGAMSDVLDLVSLSLNPINHQPLSNPIDPLLE